MSNCLVYIQIVVHPYPLPWLNNLQVPGFWTQLPQICPGLDIWHTNASMVKSCHCLDVCNVCNSTFIQLLICIYFIVLLNCLLTARITSMNPLTHCGWALSSPVASEEETVLRWDSAKWLTRQNKSGAVVRSSFVTAESEKSSNRVGVSGHGVQLFHSAQFLPLAVKVGYSCSSSHTLASSISVCNASCSVLAFSACNNACVDWDDWSDVAHCSIPTMNVFLSCPTRLGCAFGNALITNQPIWPGAIASQGNCCANTVGCHILSLVLHLGQWLVSQSKQYEAYKKSRWALVCFSFTVYIHTKPKQVIM